MKRIIMSLGALPLAGFAMIPAARADTPPNPATTTFQVKITIEKSCAVVAASDINLQTHQATETNVGGSNTINVTCSKTTPYFIGLQPASATTTDGKGTMKSATSGNTDTIAYQLQSTSGASGNPWGNTATGNSVGNGQGGTGSGSAQPYTVYVNVPAMNVTPDNYSDQVTVNVNF